MDIFPYHRNGNSTTKQQRLQYTHTHTHTQKVSLLMYSLLLFFFCFVNLRIEMHCNCKPASNRRWFYGNLFSNLYFVFTKFSQQKEVSFILSFISVLTVKLKHHMRDEINSVHPIKL